MKRHTIEAVNEAEKRYADETGTIWVRIRHSKRINVFLVAIGMFLGAALTAIVGTPAGGFLAAGGAGAFYIYLRRKHLGMRSERRNDG